MLVESALAILEEAVGLLILDEGGFFLACEDSWLNKLFTLLFEVPNQNAFGARSPKSSILETHIIDVFGVANVYLMGFT